MRALVGCGKDVIVSVVGNHWKACFKGMASDFSFIGWRINCRVMEWGVLKMGRQKTITWWCLGLGEVVSEIEVSSQIRDLLLKVELLLWIY